MRSRAAIEADIARTQARLVALDAEAAQCPADEPGLADDKAVLLIREAMQPAAADEWQDIAGQQITVGCVVVYGVSRQSSAELKYGIVTRLAQRKDGYGEPTPTIRVVSVDCSWHWHEHSREWKPQRDGREIALANLDCMLVVPWEQVPEGARAALATIPKPAEKKPRKRTA